MNVSAKRIPQEAEERPTGRFARFVHAFESWSNAHNAIVITLLSAGYVALVWKLAHRPLWFDELYTFYIAQQPTVARMLEALRTIDLNPPLNYFLTRWSIAIFGATPWATRLPAMVAFWLASMAIFAMLRARTSSMIATIGVMLFWSSAYFMYAAEARPYGLLLGFSMLLLAAWDSAIRGHRKLGLSAMMVSAVLLLLSHVFGILSLGAIWAGEAVRTWKRRKIDWPITAALLLPLVATVTYAPTFHALNHAVFPPEAQASWGKLYYLYYAQFRWMWRLLFAIAIVTVVYRKKRRVEANDWISAATATTLAILFLIPVGLTVLFMRSHGAFYDRYGMAAALPMALLVPLLLWHWTGASSKAAFAALASVGTLLLLSTALRTPLEMSVASILPPRAATKATGFLITSVHGPFRPWWKKLVVPQDLLEERAHAPLLTSLDGFHPELPLVAASELTFLEMDQRETSQVTGRLFYLYDPKAEIEIAQRTIVHGMLESKNFFPLRATIAPYTSFVGTHREFLVVGVYEHPGDWLPRKLQQDGASLQVVARNNAYDDNDLYLVTFSAGTESKGEAAASPSAQR